MQFKLLRPLLSPDYLSLTSPRMAAGVEGVQLPVPSHLRDEFLWQALKIKVLHPDQFLPVTDVKVRLLHVVSSPVWHSKCALTSELWQTRTSDDGTGTYREMTLNGSVITENIYLNEDALEVTFVKADGTGEVLLLRTSNSALAVQRSSHPPPPFPRCSTTTASPQTLSRPSASSSSACATPSPSNRCTGPPLLLLLVAASKRSSSARSCCRMPLPRERLACLLCALHPSTKAQASQALHTTTRVLFSPPHCRHFPPV